MVLQSLLLVAFDCSFQVKTLYADKEKNRGHVHLQIICVCRFI